MAKAIVTQENVSAIADALLARGEDPTLILVQEQLGGGSYSTVKRYLDAWRAQREQPMIELPPELARNALAAIQTLWSTAVAQANHRVAQVQTDAQQQIEVTQAELTQAETIIQRHEATIDTLTQQLTAAHQDVARVEQAETQARTAAQIAEARVATQEQTIAELKTELTTARGRAEDAVTAQARLDGELAALKHQLASQQALIDRLSRPPADAERAS